MNVVHLTAVQHLLTTLRAGQARVRALDGVAAATTSVTAGNASSFHEFHTCLAAPFPVTSAHWRPRTILWVGRRRERARGPHDS